MKTPRDLSGLRFGRLLVLKKGAGKVRSGKHQPTWVCQCDCGTIKEIHRSDLMDRTTSCGCKRREMVSQRRSSHKMSQTRTFNIWVNMKQRCLNPSVPHYSRYGGRGIQVCKEWHSFSCFLADMGECPSADYSIDRIDNNGNYEPGNCRWATAQQQASNRRLTLKFIWDGKPLSIIEIARANKVKYHSLRHFFLKREMPLDQAIIHSLPES